MERRYSKAQVLHSLPVTVTRDDLAGKIRISGNQIESHDIAERFLDNYQGSWKTRAMVRWLNVENVGKTKVTLGCPENSGKTSLTLGSSTRFLSQATQVMVSIYSVEEDNHGDGNYMTDNRFLWFLYSYLQNLTQLTVLEKLKEQISGLAEERAREHGWGVSPFLSPGSVHGWDLQDLPKLCALMPISEINVKVTSGGSLDPHMSIACLIGIGPEYTKKKVGETCSVCSKRKSCDMRYDSSHEAGMN